MGKTKTSGDPASIARALSEALLDGDVETFKEILKSHYEELDIDQALKRSSLSRRTFYDVLSKKGNPRLDTIMKMVKGLGISPVIFK